MVGIYIRSLELSEDKFISLRNESIRRLADAFAQDDLSFFHL